MKKQFFFTCEDQQNMIQTLKLDCKFAIGLTTYLCKINMSEIEDEFVIILSERDNGTILQKWLCEPDTDTITIYKNLPYETHTITCPGPGAECDDAADDDNIQCYLCELKIDDTW
jgi:hypothetical protein